MTSVRRSGYLAPSVRAEPLVGPYRAWTHLIPAPTLAANLQAKYLPSLEAFAAGRADSPLARSIALPADRQAEMGQLAVSLRRSFAEQLGLADALRQLDSLLATHADGHALEQLYPHVPAPLRGLVELVYDRSHRASWRIMEPLVYAGSMMPRWAQGVWVGANPPACAPSSLRTPRRPDAGALVGRLPFADPAWDVLAGARTRRTAVDELGAALGLDSAQERALSALTVERPPAVAGAPAAGGVRARFLGHACVLLEGPSTTVLVDPLIVPPAPGESLRFSFADLPEHLDAVLVTHGHMDHLDIETLLQLRSRVSTVVVPRNGGGDLADPSLALIMHEIGFGDVREVRELEAVALPGGQVIAVPFQGEHSDLAIVAKTAYVVTIDGHAALLTADSRSLDDRLYELVRAAVGPVGTAFVGMECEGSPLDLANGLYLALPATEDMAQSRRTNASDAGRALAVVSALGCCAAYVYAMGLEPWLAYMFGVPDPRRSESLAEVDRFVAGCADLGVHAELLTGAATIPLAGAVAGVHR